MKRSFPRSASQLSPALLKRVNAYALAASAAGIGVMALVPPAEAKIVYTPANIKIVPNHGLIMFDLNHDGIPDFGLSNRTNASSFGNKYGTLKVQEARSANQIWDVYSHTMNAEELCAAALPKGKLVGPKGAFMVDPKYGIVMAEVYFSSAFGPWLKVKQAFLGLKFVINKKNHFGWARLNVKINRTTFTATLTGYAYETIPNKPIIAGQTKGSDALAIEPASLGHLARGAAAISAADVKQFSPTTPRFHTTAFSQR